MRRAVQIPGIVLPEPSNAVLFACSAEFPGMLGLRRLAGRDLSASDVESSRKVVVISETLAARYFGEPNPIGRTIRFSGLTTPPGAALADFEVIGIVQDVTNPGATGPADPQAYLPFTATAASNFALVVRTSGEPMAVADAIRREVRRVDGSVAFSNPTSLDRELLQSYYSRPRFNALLLGVFAGTGLVLVTLGIYGVVAYTVSQQTRQIAIRMALGGERRHVLRMVLRGGLMPVTIGLAAGMAGGALTNRLLESVLWRVSTYDPVTIGATIALVSGIGICACCVPAWRAMRVEPVVALRHE